MAGIPATLKRYANMIDSVDDERETQNGWWVYLKRGWIYRGDVHQIHEDTLAQCAACFASVEPCSCPQCESVK